jgi:hypothetical protein
VAHLRGFPSAEIARRRRRDPGRHLAVRPSVVSGATSTGSTTCHADMHTLVQRVARQGSGKKEASWGDVHEKAWSLAQEMR